MKKILFLCEHVTWSQIVRSVVLARGLDPREYEVHFACGTFNPKLFGVTSFQRHDLLSVEPSRIEAALENGDPIYETSVLSKYVDAERRLFDKVRPDVVVSDLRWSTAISAPLAGVPVATIVNAFWSRNAMRSQFPLPDHPILKLVSIAMAEKYFPIALPKVLKHFAKPVNTLRKRHGLSEIGSLEDVITWGDRVLFPDDPALVPLRECPPHHLFLGHVAWAPDALLPSNFGSLGRTRPLVYATLGSSGQKSALGPVIDALGKLPVDALVATAGRAAPTRLPENVQVVDMVPGHLVARRASVVVCNGGASTAYQALAEGTPVVGIPSNLDQFLAMTAIRDAKAGVMLRASTLSAAAVRDAVRNVLSDGSFRERALALSTSFAQLDPHARFRAAIDDLAAGALDSAQGAE